MMRLQGGVAPCNKAEKLNLKQENLGGNDNEKLHTEHLAKH